MCDKFHVNFRSYDSENSSEIAWFNSLDEAVSLAHGLHCCSNVPHTITVVSDSHCQTELTLKLSDDA